MDPSEMLRLVREARRLLYEAGDGPTPPTCAECGQTPPLEATFCVGCGHRLRFPCPECERLCRTGQAHCAHCGHALTAEVVAGTLTTLAEQAEEERRRREEDLLRDYEKTRVLEEGRVRHLLGTRRDDGRQEFVKVAYSGPGRRLLSNELAMLERVGEHPGVVKLLRQRSSEEQLVAVFEHVPSEGMRFPVAIPRLLRITSSLLSTLAHVHAQGVVHADLKPAHVMLPEGADDRPVLIDWNVSQEPGPSRFEAFTPMFAAPEQIVGDHLDHRVDLYAVGVILYLLFTHDRFPAVLEEASEHEPMRQVLQAKKAMNRAYLSEATVYKGKLASLQQQDQVQQLAPSSGSGLEERRVLGAKYLFSSELARTQDVNAEIRVTGDVLKIVQRATAVDPDDRYPDAAAMQAAVDDILTRLEA
ncbi:MAG TPA: hypothetical protein DEA08_05570 [Planctomycetes bacterium]|nr:hypothetical protein [Planctomycetota bacterium]